MSVDVTASVREGRFVPRVRARCHSGLAGHM